MQSTVSIGKDSRLDSPEDTPTRMLSSFLMLMLMTLGFTRFNHTVDNHVHLEVRCRLAVSYHR